MLWHLWKSVLELVLTWKSNEVQFLNSKIENCSFEKPNSRQFLYDFIPKDNLRPRHLKLLIQ